MKVSHETVEAFRITELRDLDPIAVVICDYGGGQGRIMVECYGAAWSAYWGAMGDRTLREFFTDCSVGYLAQRFVSPQHKQGKSDMAYLRRVIEAVKEAMRPTETADRP